MDSTYMTAALMLSGQGGWPLTIIMTPDKRPFFAATYLPKESKQGMIGLLDLLPALADFWKEKRADLETSASKVVLALKSISKNVSGEELKTLVFDRAFQQLLESFDEYWAGFDTAPKFPTPHRLTFLLRYWQRTREPMALFMVDRTLEAMRHGGIFDQVGLGFHRYATDRKWIVPHFEKMLYDQALLSLAYLECYQANGKKEFASTAKSTLDYVLRDLTSPEGGFYSAEDADSEGVEGKFYLWTEEELKKALTPEEARAVFDRFDVHAEGNYSEGLMGTKKGNNILHLTKELHQPPEPRDEDPLIALALEKLFHQREKRVRPMKDDKILIDWNGLMLAAMATAARVLSEKKFEEAAKRCAALLIEKGSLSGGRLKHVLKEETISGFLHDYAFLAWGLLELYETTFETEYLKRAIELCDSMIANFWDDKSGGFFETAGDSEDLLARKKEAHDGAVPSGNSIATLILYKLYLITEREDFRDYAVKTEMAFSKAIQASPENFTQFLNAVDLIIGPTYEVTLVGPMEDGMNEMLAPLRSKFIPRKIVIVKWTDISSDIEQISPLSRNREAIDGKPTAYICSNKSCKPPVTSSQELLKAVDST